MTTTDAHWATEGYDIHVIAGTKLDKYLFLGQSGGAAAVPASPKPADVNTVEFTPTFTGTVSGDTLTQSGVRIDRKSGVVETVGALGRLRNFIVEAKVTLTGGTTLESGPVRVHVHHRLEAAWLTPVKLTIPLDDPPPFIPLRGYRLTLLAAFAEDAAGNVTVVGDITRQSGLLFSGGTAQHITWSSNNPGVVSVDANSGELTGHAVGDAIITAQFPAGLQSTTGVDPTATVVCRGAWPAVAVKPMSRVSTSFAARNVLILPEGFANTERAEFERLAGLLVGYLQSEVVTPLKLLPISYWTAWIDLPTPPGGQPDRSVSVLPAIELSPYRFVDPNWVPTEGTAIEDATKPRSAPGATPARIWTLRELVYQVGLPLPSDSAATPLATKLQQWQSLVGAAKIDATVVDDALLIGWRFLSDYRLTEERDSVFSLARGNRPRVGGGEAERIIDLHPLRMTRDHLDRFLSQLTLNGVAVGSRWTDPKQDRKFVIFLCAGAPRAGVHSPDNAIITSTLSDEDSVDFDVAAGVGLGSGRVRLRPKPLPKSPSLDARSTVAHELAHGLGLGDEYGEDPTITPDLAPFVVDDPNLQLASDLLVAGKIKAGDIRWRWPRIRKAALLADSPTIVGNEVKILLQPGYDARFKENAFKKGDVVRLRDRQREKVVPGGAGHRVSQVIAPSTFRLRISEDPKPGVGPGGKPVVVITAVPEPPGSPLPALPSPYAKDSLLILPVPDPANPGQDLMLMAKFIEDRIAADDAALNRRKTEACQPDDNDSQIPRRLSDSPWIRLKRPRLMQRVIGVYDGGMTYHCGAYHPTGACMMRGQFFWQLTVIINLGPGPAAGTTRTTYRTYPFCHVCRYILAETYDPTIHAVIDRDFERNYPEKK